MSFDSIEDLLSNNYLMTTDEFSTFKNIIIRTYNKCLQDKISAKELKSKMGNKLDYFKQEGFINYYELKKANKKEFETIVNLGNELIKISLGKGGD